MFNFSRNQLIAASIIVAITLAGTVALAFKSNKHGAGEGIRLIQPGDAASESEPSTTNPTAEPQDTAQKICVHVAGCVKSPGLYNLEPGSRVTDAIKAAGGAKPNADLDSVNLAEKLSDAQKVYVARKGETTPPVHSTIEGGSPKPAMHKVAAKKAEDSPEPEKLIDPNKGKVNLNTADLKQLQRLPGVGPSTAEKIIEYRREHGRFQAIDELDEVRGIGPAKLAKMKPFLVL